MITFKQIYANFNLLAWSLLAVRTALCILPVCWLYLFHEFLSKLIFLDIVRRYLSCVSNLVCIRFILLVLGFLRFENNSFKFFNRSFTDKFTLRSGYIGIGSHSNIIDFLFYNYIMSPTFVRILIVKSETNKTEFMYIPLTFLQALKCAMTARGFEPIVVPEKELNKIKERKLSMPLLVVENFENLKGPILILLPGIDSKEYIKIDKKIVDVIHGNEIRFSRWTVGFHVCTPGIRHIYMKQMDLIMDLMESFKTYTLKAEMTQFHRNVNYIQNFETVIGAFYAAHGCRERDIDYEVYTTELDQKEAEAKEKEKKQKEGQSESCGFGDVEEKVQ